MKYSRNAKCDLIANLVASKSANKGPVDDIYGGCWC